MKFLWMNTKVILFTCFILLANNLASHGQSIGDSSAYKPELDIIFSSFKSKNYDLIKPLLDPQVKIDELPRGMNDLVVPQLLGQLPQPISYSVTGVAKEHKGTRVVTTYTYADGSSREQRFLFNAVNKIIEFDVLRDAKKVTTKSACTPEGKTITRD